MNLGPSAPWSGINGQFYSLIEHYGYLVVFFGVMLGDRGHPFPERCHTPYLRQVHLQDCA
jgi:hypothetical protein